MAGILSGIDPLVDTALGVADVGEGQPHYQHRESWDRLAKLQGVPDRWPDLVSRMSSLIENNWDGRASRGLQNWRHSQERTIAKANASLEKCIEKGVVNVAGSAWTNQVPICSGVNDGRDGKRCVDLALLNGEDLELVELKVNSNTPLFAAVEVLIYGLVYRFSRRHRDTLGYTPRKNPLVFNVTRVALKVLAPGDYYGDRLGALKGIEDGIGIGLAALTDEGYRTTFL